MSNFRTWPLGLDSGAEVQFTKSYYCQPPAKPQLQATVSRSADSSDQYLKSHKTEEVGEQIEIDSCNFFDDNEEEDSDFEDDNDCSCNDLKVPTEADLYHSSDVKVNLLGTDGKIYNFFVSSHALVLVSRVWTCFLNPLGFRELDTELHNNSSVRILRLEGDDPRAIWLILKIIHMNYSDLPMAVSYQLLRQLALVCDKYECGDAMQLWTWGWIRRFNSVALEPGFEDWMFICKILAPSKTMSAKLSRALVLECSSVSRCGSYMLRRRDGEEYEVDLQFIPDKIQKYIMDERSKAIDKIVTTLRQYVTELSSTTPHPMWDHTPIGVCTDEECQNMALGSLLRSLKRLDLWPLLRSEEPQQWHASALELQEKLENIKMNIYLPGLATIEDSLYSSSEEDSHRVDFFVNVHQSIIHIKLLGEHTCPWRARQFPSAWAIEKLRCDDQSSHTNDNIEEINSCETVYSLGKVFKMCRGVTEEIEDAGYTDLRAWH